MTRLTLLTEIPAPFRIPLFNALGDRVDLTVLFLRERHPERPYRLHEKELRFEWHVLPGMHLRTRNWWLVLNRGVIRALRRAQPDVVLLGGWNQPALWGALAWARVRRVPTILWVESTGRDRRSGRLESAKRMLLRAPSAFLVPGAASHDYLRALGVGEERIAVAPNAVDPAIFRAPAERDARERPVVLAVGRLSAEKGLDVLLRAAETLPVDVVLAGTGPEEERLRALAGPHVRFLGHVDRDELPRVYASADVLAMPSRSEPWGMALNEGALAGLPLVASDAAGAAYEVIEHGGNGFRVPAEDVEALREALRQLADHPDLRVRMGARSRELASSFSPGVWAARVAELATTLARR